MSRESSEEERLNSLVVEIRVLESTFNELSSRQNLLERALLESRAALDAIKGLNEGKSDQVLIQIGGGAMVRAPPPDIEKVLVNVGSSVVLEKPREEAVALLDGRAREIEKSVVSLINQRNEIAQRLEADRQVLQNYLNRQGQKD